MTGPIKPLWPEQMFTACDAAGFAFETTAGRRPARGRGRARLIEAIDCSVLLVR